MIQPLVFFALSAAVLVPALLAVSLKNIFHSALFLVVSLTGVAGLFAMMGADFLFVAQLLVYSGGIVVLLMFVVLLSGSPKDWILRQVNGQWLLALVVSAVFVWLIFGVFRALPPSPDMAEAVPTTASLGLLLLRELALPFEAVSLVLLASLAGAVYFTEKDDASS